MTRDGSVIRRYRCASLQTLARFFTVFILVITAAAIADAQTPIGTIGLTPGWATFGQAVPEGAAPSGLQVGSLLTQTDVKTRWPDGSIRFAVVTVNALTAGNYAITAAPLASGAFTPGLPTASVALAIGAATYTATLPTTASTDRWLSGALVYEGRSAIAPVSSADGSAHPFLRVIFDTRVYADGTGRVDLTVENVLDQVGATTVTYNLAVTVNGQSVFTRTAVQHYYLTRWRKMFGFGTTPAAITPDIKPFNDSGALPPYLSLVANMVSSPTGASYDILQSGALTTNMPDHGGRAELAPYPDWTARYLVNKNQTQRTFVLANGDLAGSWPVHVREPENSTKTGVGLERLVSINQRPRLWLDERSQTQGYDYVKGTPLPIKEYGLLTPGPGQSPLIPDNAHQPSLAYVPYLLTGDRYYAEEMAFWANYAMIRTYPGDGVRSSSGILEYNEVRGFGWGLRNIVDAAAMYPDASSVRAYLTAKVAANLQWLDNYANVQDLSTNPFQILWILKRPDGDQYISMWEQTYLMHAIDRARQQGFTGGLAHRDAIAKFQLKLFTSDPDYPRAQAAPYVVAVGVPTPPPPATATDVIFFTSMAQIWAGTQGQERPFAGYYGPEARMSLLVGIQNGWAGAQGAYDYLWPFIGTTSTFCPDGGPDMPDLACRAGWALALPGASPPPITAPARLTSPAPGSTLGASSQAFTWDAGLGVTSYRLDVGTTQGANDILAGSATTATSLNVTGLPIDGSTIWVRLSSNIGGAWQFVDYSFITATIPNGRGGALAVRTTVFADGTGTVSAGPFNTSAGDLLIAFATAAGPGTGGQTLTITSTATAGLTWTRVTRANSSPGIADIWWAWSPTSKTNIRVTSTLSASTYTESLTVVVFAGAAGVGASATASATGAPSVSLTATAAGSLVFGVGNDWDGAVARTLGPNQSMTHQWLSTATGDTYWVQNATPRTPIVGAVVPLNDTAPTGDRFNFAAVEIVPAVIAVAPTITWSAPSPIVYGTALGAAQLNATANVAGNFVYTPPLGTVLGAGTGQTLSVTFTPIDTIDYTTATKTVPIDVTLAPTTITWAAPSPVVYGTPLGATQLNATASVPGTFVYTPPIGTILNAGTGQTLSVTFNPTDASNYTAATQTVAITVTKATPMITWSAPADLIAGTPLGATQLNASATVPGTFVYTPAAGTVLNLGSSQALSVFFTPTAATNYNTASQSVSINVIAPPPISSVTLVASQPAPQVPGTAITFTAAASGGVGPYQYKWFLFDGTTWTVAQAWSPAATFTWTPTVANANYQITVGARSVGNTSEAAEKAVGTIYPIQAAVVSGITLVANRPAPQLSGTPITFTAAASGGVSPYQYKWFLYDGTTWTVAQAWSSAATFTWTPTVVNASYQITVGARSAGNTSEPAEKAVGLAYPIQGPVSNVTLVANRPAPQTPGTTITFTASAAGGIGPYQYKWFLFDGTTWTVAQSWSSAATFTWTPPVANANYQITAGARSAGDTSEAAEKAVGTLYPIQSLLSSVTLAASQPAPQVPGTAITFTAFAAGGVGPYQYKWFLFDGTTWTVAQAWSSAATFTWTPTVANANYQITVGARSAGNTSEAAEKAVGTIYPIQAALVSSVTLAANRPAPQVSGTTVTFTASAVGGVGPYQYQWFLFDGTTWTVAQAWSSAATFTWTPAVANANYQITVGARSAGNTSAAAEKAVGTLYPILAAPF